MHGHRLSSRWAIGSIWVNKAGQCAGVVDVLMRRQRRSYLARLHVQHEMDFTPRAPLGVAALAHLLSTFAVEFHASTVHTR